MSQECLAGLAPFGWLVHSRNDSAIPMVLGVGVFRAKSFLRLSLPSSSFLDTCFDFCSVVGDSVFSFASCAFLCTLYDHWSCVFSSMDFASMDFAHFMALWVGYTCCRHSVTAHFMARWWVTHIVGFDSLLVRLVFSSFDHAWSSFDDGRCMVAS